MSTKITILSALLAAGALATPTTPPASQLERRADWQEGKCEAHIALNSKTKDCNDYSTTASNNESIASNGLEVANPTSKWEVNIIDNPGNQIGNWGGTNPADIQISTSKGHNFVIEGHPTGNFLDGQSSQNALTLSYNTQKWNGLDYYRYVDKSTRPSNG